ncbi:hypothetical protein V6N11_018953 [Hibiscus sabdariffa]|uniref:Uncharacterized protein n=1 Tax=Hibiscus sabdariffa TaxID=183260 RepID=A0ABR2R161_9ROSI
MMLEVITKRLLPHIRDHEGHHLSNKKLQGKVQETTCKTIKPSRQFHKVVGSKTCFSADEYKVYHPSFGGHGEDRSDQSNRARAGAVGGNELMSLCIVCLTLSTFTTKSPSNAKVFEDPPKFYKKRLRDPNILL